MLEPPRSRHGRVVRGACTPRISSIPSRVDHPARLAPRGGKDWIDASGATTAPMPDDGYPSPPARLDRTRWTDLPQDQAARQRRGSGTTTVWSKVGAIADGRTGVLWLTADFNCTVTDPAYVNEILDRLVAWSIRASTACCSTSSSPFPTTSRRTAIDVRSVSARKPLFMDESAHDWRRGAARPRTRLDRGRAEDLQDADWRAALVCAGRRRTA